MTGGVEERLAVFARAFDLPALVRQTTRDARAGWATALQAAGAGSIRRLVISGCGDSLFAAVAARLAVERFAGLPCEPMDALECGRYAAAGFGPDVAVVGVSNSGTTSRVLESVALAARAGARTLALTGAPDSPLHRLAAAGVARPVVAAGGPAGPTARVARHLREYVGTLVALFALAWSLGLARGRLTEREVAREEQAVEAAAVLAQRTLQIAQDAVTPVLALVGDAERIYYLGAGPAYGTALFGAAKVVEEVPMCGVPQHLEEWAHLEYFLTMVEGARTRAVAVLPPGDSTDRGAEILEAIRADGGVAIAVTSPQETAVCAAAAAVLAVDGDVWEGYAPLPYVVPLQVLGIALALHRGQPVVPLRRRDGGRLIRASAIRGLQQA
ncbi:MAG: SIS domain-containing protein [Armatimonadota bacterium]|nr:SIS domain-containing protein [Armatimonadota bacterium]MDR7485925.1 SIS domain-containing protein [Armatimonadota bacterium]MDR7533124.1 SIS domain-containing protein [Armatimonadota bacterium]MDR7536630.1 SIS domain-containing protein [Armatimonadota bacterium]